jgi:hypothetical protein
MNRLLEGRHTLRLGTQDFIHMYFNLQSLLTITKNLDCLDEPFTKEEIAEEMLGNCVLGLL